MGTSKVVGPTVRIYFIAIVTRLQMGHSPQMQVTWIRWLPGDSKMIMVASGHFSRCANHNFEAMLKPCLSPFIIKSMDKI
jgi:hypothetical protein